MKNKKVIALILLTLFVATLLAACGNDVEPQSGAMIYDDTIVYDLSSEADVSVKFDHEKVETLAIGRNEYTEGFGVSDGILTISASIMKEQTASENKTLNVTLKDGKTVSIPMMICTKIIKTAEDFQNINEDLEGIYVLGNDIDLSSIPNFEPLGFFFTEEDTRNSYFHGVLDGNGYKIMNASIDYNMGFEHSSHVIGNNIGIFQIIGSSGVVRNCTFFNCTVKALTIAGIIAGNNSGLIENCFVSGGSVNIDTHFWEDDCNVGGAVGINAASGTINNVICTAKASITWEFIHYSDEYIGIPPTAYEKTNVNDAYWTFWGDNRDLNDSNGVRSNGCYAFCGKSWGTINNSFAIKQQSGAGDKHECPFAQTHLGANKPASSTDNMGTLNGCGVYTAQGLRTASLYSSFDTSIWTIKDGVIPSVSRIYTYTVHE